METVTVWHPPVVHFAVVLPIITTIFYLTYLKKQHTSLLKTTEYFVYATVIFIVAAWYTGGHDGKMAYEALLMNSDEGVEELKEHAGLGQMLAIFSVAVLVMFKLAQNRANRYLNWIVAASLIFVTVAVLKQGKDGGELVYKYAANVEIPVSDDENIFEE